MECQVKANGERCNCTYHTCARKGKCCECLSFHLSCGELPACAFPPEVERSYDRSFARFVRTYQERRGKPW